MSCQKVINVLAVASAAVSVAVVGVGGYVYLNKDAIIQDVTEKVLGSLGGLGGGISPELPTGTNDLSPSAPQASSPTAQQAELPSFN